MSLSIPPPVHNPFVALLGCELQRFEINEAEIVLSLREELSNAWGVAHGGVMMTLLDIAMAHAARTPATPGAEAHPGVVTLEMKTMFVRPGRGRLFSIGRVLHRTASLAFCEGHVRDAGGELLAHGSGTFKYMQALPVGGRRIQRMGASD
jgi:uncharacterized protein (TIGR00369 family)